jgi:hypothetical protein
MPQKGVISKRHVKCGLFLNFSLKVTVTLEHLFLVHFVTKLNLYFWYLCKILRFIYTKTPYCEKNICDPYTLYGKSILAVQYATHEFGLLTEF